MKRLFLTLALLSSAASLALPAAAQTAAGETISQEIGRTGLAATELRLESLRSPTDQELFALGGVRFLATVEQALQIRWRAGLTDRMGMIPFLRLPMDENPAPGPFDPKAVAGLFRAVVSGMNSAQMPLSMIPETSDFGLDISLGDLWFDINANGSRDPGEDLVQVTGAAILGQEVRGAAPVIRFDVADAAWLSAYTHLLAGISQVVLAYDPTASIGRVMDTKARLAELSPSAPGGMDDGFGEFADIAFVVIDALRQNPDRDSLLSAHAQFLKMVSDNRAFWARVARETDNDREWLPNDRQQSALGVAVPQGTGEAWMAVLNDFEALLKGEKLAPYWRLGSDDPAPGTETAGIDIGRLFLDPAPIDLAGWIQGSAALPYASKGPLVSGASWQAFDDMVSGDAMLFTIFLN